MSLKRQLLPVQYFLAQLRGILPTSAPFAVCSVTLDSAPATNRLPNYVFAPEMLDKACETRRERYGDKKKLFLPERLFLD